HLEPISKVVFSLPAPGSPPETECEHDQRDDDVKYKHGLPRDPSQSAASARSAVHSRRFAKILDLKSQILDLKWSRPQTIRFAANAAGRATFLPYRTHDPPASSL